MSTSTKLQAILLQALLISLSGCVAIGRESDRGAHGEAQVLINKGVAHLRERELDLAQASFDLAWELDESPAALDGLGCVAFLRGDQKRAESYLLAAIKFDPKYGAARANLALLYELSGARDRALELYSEALNLEPNNVTARNNFAVALIAGGADNKGTATHELLKAEAIVSHPIISDNIKRAREDATW